MHDASSSEFLMPTYARLPVAFTRGEGAWLWDVAGRRYLDALGGIAVCGLGHCHPDVVAALQTQAATLIHTSNLYGIPLQEQLAARLAAISDMQRVFFGNSGAEANEAALKLARLHGHARGIEEPAVIVVEGAFHGRTLATLSATASRAAQAGFEPLVQGFVRAPYGDLDAIERIGRGNPPVSAVLVEPIQGESGVRLPPPGYLAGLRALCDRFGWLLMLDEIQTGMGRTGRWFAHQHDGIRPDVMTLAKALGNGVPIGACLAAGPAADLFGAGHHGSTFGGNPLACSAALATLGAIENQGLVARAAALGATLLERLRDRLDDCGCVREVRGRGLMLGIELDRECAVLVSWALERGLLINVAGGRTVRLLPPLILDDEQATLLVDEVVGLIQRFEDED